MKLLERYNRVNLVATIIVLFITGIVYYWAISYILNHQVDKDILIEEQEIFTYIQKNNSLPPVVDYKDQQIKFLAIDHPCKRHFLNTDYYNSKERENESGRGLITFAKVGGQYYKITIIESKVEAEDLIRIIFIITIGVILFLLLILFVTNRFILNRMWQPFYSILYHLRAFTLSDKNEIVQTDSSIDEFKELNSTFVSMASRVKTDYQDLKTFTENASHELLTPIAVINSKLDSLIQTGDFNDIQSKLLTDVYGAVSRITRLNQSLLLLVKIENQLLKDEQVIDMKPFVEEKVDQFNELFIGKSLAITCSLQSKQVTASKYLIDVLLNNLLSNAIKHSNLKGSINITLNSQLLMIENTGSDIALSENDIFKRFNKSANSEGTGLGLTIAKQICDNYGFKLNYHFQQPSHIFTVTF